MAEEYELEHSSGVERMQPQLVSASAGNINHEDQEGGDDVFKGHGELDRRVVRKLDLLLLPFLSLFFLVNSLDRSNVGNAETANFTADTGLQPGDLNTATACFFAFFVALQPIGAACGRYFGMRLWVPSCMCLWGGLTLSHIWIRAKWQLALVRILIGILEAGFYPVTVAYISLFYTRYEFARRLGVFYGQYALAGAVGGVLAYGVFTSFPGDDVPGVGVYNTAASQSWRPWQILFLIEGSLTIIIAIIGFFWLPDSADTAWFLSQTERRWGATRIKKDRQAEDVTHTASGSFAKTDDDDRTNSNNIEDEAETLLVNHESNDPQSTKSITDARGLSAADVLAAFTDWKVYYLLLMNILSAIPAAAFTVFLPLIVKGFGFNATRANLFTAPPFLLGALVLWFFTWWSDRRQERLIPILYGLAILLSGLTAVVMLPHTWTWARYGALCVLLGGSFVASPLTIAWFTGNIESPGKRAVVLGINGWGNLAGVFSSLLFAPRFAPDYSPPFFVTLALVMVSFIGFMLFRKLLVEQNKRVIAARGSDMHDTEGRSMSLTVSRSGKSGWLARLLLRYGFEVEKDERHGQENSTSLYGL